MTASQRPEPGQDGPLPARFLRNSISNYATTAVSAVLALVMTPVLAGNLGPEGFGIWAFAFSMALYLEVFEFGFGAATVKFVAEHAGRGERDEVRRVITTSVYALAIPGALALAAGALIALAFPAIFPELDAATAADAQVVILLVALDLAISLPADTFGGTLLGLQRYDLVNLTLTVVAVAQAAGAIAVFAFGGGLVELAVVTVALSLLGQFSRFWLAARLVGGVDLRPRRFEPARLAPFARLSAWIAVAESSALAVMRLDTVVVGLVAGLPAAGIYAVGQKIPLAVNLLQEPLAKLFFPHSAELHGRSETSGLRAAFLLGTRLTLGVALPLALTFALLAEPTLEAWVGAEFADAAAVVVLLLGAVAVWAATKVGVLMLQGAGEVRRPALVQLAEAILNLGLSVALGLAMGATGVALATLIAAVVTNLGVLVPLLCRRFEVPIGAFASSVLRSHGPALVVAGALGALLAGAVPATLPAVALASTAIVVAYAAVFAFSGLTRAERAAVLARLQR